MIILEKSSQLLFQSFPVRLEYFIILFRDTPTYPILSEGAILATQRKNFLYVKSESVSVFGMPTCLADVFCALLH